MDGGRRKRRRRNVHKRGRIKNRRRVIFDEARVGDTDLCVCVCIRQLRRFHGALVFDRTGRTCEQLQGSLATQRHSDHQMTKPPRHSFSFLAYPIKWFPWLLQPIPCFSVLTSRYSSGLDCGLCFCCPSQKVGIN